MKVNQTRIGIAVILVFILSCQQGNEFKKFPKEINMDQYVIDSFKLEKSLNPGIIALYDTLLFAMEGKPIEGFFSVYNIDDMSLLIDAGKIGRGPNEFIYPGALHIDKLNNLVCFIDFGQNMFFAYSLDSLVMKGEFRKVFEFQIDPLLLAMDSYFITKDTTIIVSTSDENSLFTILSKEGNIIERYGEIDMDKNLPFYVNMLLHDRYFCMDSLHKNLVFGFSKYDKIIKYNIDSESTEQISGPDFIKPSFSITEDETYVANENTELAGFYSIENCEGYIYHLYLGHVYMQWDKNDAIATYPSKIHIYDKDIAPYAELNFFHEIKDFKIDTKNKILYTLLLGEDFLIKSYDISFIN